MKFTILTIFKYTVQGHCVHSYCSIALTNHASPERSPSPQTETLPPLNSNSLSPFHPASGNQHPIFRLCESDYATYPHVSGIIQY